MDQIVPVTLFMADRYLSGAMPCMFFPDAREAGRLYLYRITPMGSKAFPAIIGWVDIEATTPASKGQMIVMSGLRGRYGLHTLELDIETRGLRYAGRIIKATRYQRVRRCTIEDGGVAMRDE